MRANTPWWIISAGLHFMVLLAAAVIRIEQAIAVEGGTAITLVLNPGERIISSFGDEPDRRRFGLVGEGSGNEAEVEFRSGGIPETGTSEPGGIVEGAKDGVKTHWCCYCRLGRPDPHGTWIVCMSCSLRHRQGTCPLQNSSR